MIKILSSMCKIVDFLFDISISQCGTLTHKYKVISLAKAQLCSFMQMVKALSDSWTVHLKNLDEMKISGGFS